MSVPRSALSACVLVSAVAPASAALHDVVLRSELNRRDVPIKVYTPPGYENGSPERQWERAGATIQDAMDAQKVRPMIYVFANALGNTLFLDYADGSLKVESMIVRELIPFIDKRYRTSPRTKAALSTASPWAASERS